LVRAIELPSAMLQLPAATLLGMTLAWALGWQFGAGLVSVLSLRSPARRSSSAHRTSAPTSIRGVALGWLIAEGLPMALALSLDRRACHG
jgi:monovalent cation:H+ antiporter-2, CPA2 family